MSNVLTMTLTGFLLARIAEDSQIVAGLPAPLHDIPRGAEIPGWLVGRVVMDRDRLIAELEAKRRIVSDLTRYEQTDAPEVEGAKRGLRMAARALAAVYADHPDYDAGWAA